MHSSDPAIQLYQSSLLEWWAETTLDPKTPCDEPNILKPRKIAAVLDKTSFYCTDTFASSNGVQPTRILLEQQITFESSSEASLGNKRKADGVIEPKLNGSKASESAPRTKKHADSRHNPLPQPGVPYQVLCGKDGYVPAIVHQNGVGDNYKLRGGE